MAVVESLCRFCGMPADVNVPRIQRGGIRVAQNVDCPACGRYAVTEEVFDALKRSTARSRESIRKKIVAHTAARTGEPFLIGKEQAGGDSEKPARRGQ